MKPLDAIGAIANALRDESNVRALFLSGSFGVGIEDEYSDLDFLAVAAAGSEDRFPTLWRNAVERVGDVVLWWGHVKRSVTTAVTADWLRIDVDVATPEQVLARSRSNLRVLFDHDGLFDALPERVDKPEPSAERWRWQFENFIRILGLMTVAIGREDYLTGVTGVFHLRNMLIDLLIEETAAPNRGGALHLHRLITADQKSLLESMPPPTPTRQAVIGANLAYAAAYLPPARRMAQKLGIEWPERFETATWAHLKHHLAVERPSGL